ncbi:hypothetical protein [Aquimonas sp.]|jgi:hypothetical protein|uniref:hypothetical protein n=1 Tax=Aquimonas sp. TaxID=1872588 RepID=UPI0037C0AA9A
MNKKVLGGCLIVAVLVLLIGGGGLFWFVLRPAWQAGSALMDTAQQWQQVAQLEGQVRNRAPYSGAEDGRLGHSEVERFVAVQQAIADRLGDRWTQLDQKYRELKDRQQQDGREPGVQDMFVAYADLSALIVEAKQAQVDALNAQDMSLEEFRWVRAQAFASIGLAISDETPTALAGSVTAANAELLRPYRDLLTRTAATGWLGF